MFKSQFKKLKQIEDEEDMDELEMGECFLYGRNMINQFEKASGQDISYWMVIKKNKNGIEYAPVFDILQED